MRGTGSKIKPTDTGFTNILREPDMRGNGSTISRMALAKRLGQMGLNLKVNTLTG